METVICRHIKTNGRRCKSPSLGLSAFCYFHSRLHRRHKKSARKRSRSARKQLQSELICDRPTPIPARSARTRTPTPRRRRIHPGLHLAPRRRPGPQPHRLQTCRRPPLRPAARLQQRPLHHHRTCDHFHHSQPRPHQIRHRPGGERLASRQKKRTTLSGRGGTFESTKANSR
jgi:hypothetical protein